MFKNSIIVNTFSNKNLLSLICVTIVLSLWAAIDTHFFDVKLNNFKDFVQIIRSIAPYTFFIIFIIFVFIKNIKSIFINFFFNIIIFFVFIIQIPGLFYSFNSILNLFFILNCLIYLYILNYFYQVKKLNNLLSLSFSILAVVFLFFGTGLMHWLIFESKDLNLYGSWPHGLENFQISENVPRSSGMSRTSMIIFLISSILIIIKKNKYLPSLLSIFSLILIFTTQSRISNFFIIGYLIFYHCVLCFLKITVKEKFVIFFISFLIPIIFISGISYYQVSKSSKNKLIQSDIETIIQKRLNRPIDDVNVGFGSGRGKDWKKIIQLNKNYFLGNGAMGDRYLINQSASNFFVYSYSSAGLVGLVLGIILYFISLTLAIKNLLLTNFQITKKNYKTIICSNIILYLLFRCIGETSFGIFGIDFLIFFCCFYYLIQNSNYNIYLKK